MEQEDTSSTTTGTTLNNSSNNNSCHRSISKNLEDLDPSEIPEFKPMKSGRACQKIDSFFFFLMKFPAKLVENLTFNKYIKIYFLFILFMNQ